MKRWPEGDRPALKGQRYTINQVVGFEDDQGVKVSVFLEGAIMLGWLKEGDVERQEENLYEFSTRKYRI